MSLLKGELRSGKSDYNQYLSMKNKEVWEKGDPAKGIRAKCILFTVEIVFLVHFDNNGKIINNYDRWYIHNQSWIEIGALRETLFSRGFYLERSPGRGEIIFPHDFRKILIDIQPNGWKETV